VQDEGESPHQPLHARLTELAEQLKDLDDRLLAVEQDVGEGGQDQEDAELDTKGEGVRDEDESQPQTLHERIAELKEHDDYHHERLIELEKELFTPQELDALNAAVPAADLPARQPAHQRLTALEEQVAQLTQQLQDRDQQRSEEHAELSKKLQELAEHLESAQAKKMQEFREHLERQQSLRDAQKLAADAAQQGQAEKQKQLERETKRSEQELTKTLSQKVQELAQQQTEFARTHQADVQVLKQQLQDELDALPQQLGGATDVQGLEQQLKLTHEALHALAQQVEDALEPKGVQPPLCRLPGCWQSVHMENGRFHNYCGRTHADKDGAIAARTLSHGVDKTARQFEADKLRDNEKLLRNKELELALATDISHARHNSYTTPPAPSGSRGQPALRQSPRTHPFRGSRTTQQEQAFPHEPENMSNNDLWSPYPHSS
jgi:DNA repair exonuclease SbcCD ATPase subunit